MTIRVMLWDADGVVQHSPVGWREVLDDAGGAGFAEAVFAHEIPALHGEEPLRSGLARALDAFPTASISVDELLRLWERAEIDPGAWVIVDELRAHGIRSYLATNQQDHRRAWMRDHLGYDEHFDGVFYSCDMGVIKPDLAYFQHIIDALDLSPTEMAFVDDVAAHVETASSLGIVGIHHDPAAGAAVLREEIFRAVLPGT